MSALPHSGFPTRARGIGRRRCLAVAVLLVLLLLLGGCSWQIVPPETGDAGQTVYISVYGRHTRLALPSEAGDRYLEYGFGDWRYYAKAERDWLDGLRALFASPSSALSRREVVLRASGDPLTAFRSRRTAEVAVFASRVKVLRSELEAIWAEAEGRSLVRAGHHYREIDRRYGLLHNSNHQAAQWLERLGCDIKGFPLLSDFEVKRR